MSDGAILVFTAFVSLLFMMVGILGIYRKTKFMKSITAMHMVDGMIVDHTVSQVLDEDRDVRDVYNPVYEYEWKGMKKRLKGTVSVSVAKNPVGKKVHILVDPKTETAVCLEEKKNEEAALLVFGVIGVLVFILVILSAIGVLP